MNSAMSRAMLIAISLLLSTSALKAATLDEFRIFIEFNDTDQDVGVHVFLDGEDWRVLKIFDPRGQEIYHVQATSNLGEIGLSELFFEGEEPSLEELPLDEFFAMFPEGKYQIIGRTVDGAKIKISARFSHDIPDAPVVTSPAEGATVDPDHVVISWQPVTTPAGIVIVGYEIIVGSLSVKVPATTTSLTVPPGILESGREYGFEVLSIAANHNQTITGGSFVTE